MADKKRHDPSSGPLNLSEKGKNDGEIISLDRRLFMQFLALQGHGDPTFFANSLEERQIGGALYRDINDPRGWGLVTYTENPENFLDKNRMLLNQEPFSRLDIKQEFTMLGRTYSLGHEDDLEFTLITKPIQRVTDPDLPWAVWYPVRRSGSFEELSAKEQRTILMEHGGIGQAYGKAGLAHDIRLAGHGLNKDDNDFIIGLVGPRLYPLSHLVQRMRKTKQTSRHLETLGPFFVGKAIWQHRASQT